MHSFQARESPEPTFDLSKCGITEVSFYIIINIIFFSYSSDCMLFCNFSNKIPGIFFSFPHCLYGGTVKSWRFKCG